MKRFLVFLLVLVMIFSFTACANDNTDDEPDNDNDNVGDDNNGDVSDDEDDENTLTYEDGTYTGMGEKWEHGQESSTVVIEDGQIVSVDLKRLNEDGEEVDYNNWTGEEIDGATYPNLKEYRVTMGDTMVEEQTYDVDTIAGATVSTANWKVATERALNEAVKENAED
ncbi:FMN-binding protein [Sporosalibacterium faouarense]|uniref:FMN-binding protein n=1 Tax=Sporosalibacterium faouarense TaxID=516123 RepID=UPI00141C4838|nr:FMN-binding protein [Sporosalibacterium faouarense]MTI48680.1 FMN-binding protein [Bacillota bacterium]